ncbi:hypothetical protein GCM10011352_03360 [Marinobacterium zhoushanense]|uniref:Outer membrane lipoprotein carrier protein LolA n=1 Tax=Marinobacterium zhoushanense TaxID=1679163 RepID=A0ABQ1JXC2_9GAMM|nr:outer membrane lipoprotein carrier protein LolA [Marinobacterium zhoushanense]GGB80978.1 hypothetical protein GCM10011352_03360 [Marinobacterium zhoushanense]
MIRRLVLLFSLLVFVPLAAVADYRELEALMATPPSLSGRFEQVKYLAALDTEIASSGRFAYERDREINWQTLAPIENMLRLTPERITSEQAGRVLSQLETGNNPVVALFSDIFFGVMTARWSRLAEHFDLQTRIAQSQWQVTLMPKEPRVQQVVSKVELQGGRYLREVVLHEVGGDWTRIRFYDIQQ